MNIEDIQSAAELLNFGLQFRLAPSENKAYANLLARYQREPDFADIVRSIASGQGQRILDTESLDSGLILVPANAESNYAYRLKDLRGDWTPEKRQAYALVLACVARAFFPTEESLYSNDTARVPLPESTILAEIQRTAQSYSHRDPSDVRVLDVLDGWTILERLPVTSDKEQRANRNTLSGILAYALRDLLDVGLVRAHGVNKGGSTSGSYIATTRFQVQIRETALPTWFEVIREAQARAATFTPAPASDPAVARSADKSERTNSSPARKDEARSAKTGAKDKLDEAPSGELAFEFFSEVT